MFTKLGDALLADAAMSKMLTASLASLSTLDEIKLRRACLCARLADQRSADMLS